MLKICTKCQKKFDLSEFYKDKSKKDGLSCWCKSCQKCYNEQNKEKRKQWKELNKDRLKEYQQKYDAQTRDKRLERQKAYRESHKEQIKEYYYTQYRETSKENSRKYRELHKEQLKEYDKERNRKNKLNRCMSRSIWHSLHNAKAEQHWETLVPYTLQQLREHLEKQFDKNMSWDNYGTYWEIDHIIPQNLFNIATAEDADFKICWSLMNLRPLEKSANRKRPKDGSDVSEEVKQQILGQNI